MVFEHFALNTKEPKKMAQWYCDNLDLTIVSEQVEPPFMTFLSDSSGRVVIEIYRNDNAPISDFANMHHLTFHFAFVAENARKTADFLIEKGAIFIEEMIAAPNTHIIMLRDPWNIPLQLCQRSQKLGI